MSDHGSSNNGGLLGRVAMAMGCAAAVAALVNWGTGYPFFRALVPLAALGFLGIVVWNAMPKIRFSGGTPHPAGSEGWKRRFAGTMAAAVGIGLLLRVSGWPTGQAIVTMLWLGAIAFAASEVRRHGWKLASIGLASIAAGGFAFALLALEMPEVAKVMTLWPVSSELTLADTARNDAFGDSVAYQHREEWRKRYQGEMVAKVEEARRALEAAEITAEVAIARQAAALKEYGEKIATLDEQLRVNPPLTERAGKALSGFFSTHAESTPETVANRPKGVPESATRIALGAGEDWCPQENTKLGIKGEDGREYAFVDVATGKAPTAEDGRDYSGVWPYCIRGGELGVAIWVWPKS